LSAERAADAERYTEEIGTSWIEALRDARSGNTIENPNWHP